MQAEKKRPISVVLADDRPLLREAFSKALACHDVKVVAVAATAAEAIEKYAKHSPDVLIMDIQFGEELAGLDAAKKLLQSFSDARIIFLSQFDHDDVIREAYRSGGLAYLTADADTAHLATAIERVSEGHLYFLPQVAERLATLAIRGDTSPRAQLDARAVEVFTLMAQGRTNAEIAAELHLSPKTISNISQGIKETLGVERPAEITLLAVKHQMIKP